MMLFLIYNFPTVNVCASSEKESNSNTKEINNLIEQIDCKDYIKFKSLLDANKIKSIFIDNELKDDIFYFETINNEIYYTDNPNYETFKKDLLELGIKIYDKEKIKTRLEKIDINTSTNKETSKNTSNPNEFVLIIIWSMPIILLYVVIRHGIKRNKINKKSKNVENKILIKSGIMDDSKNDIDEIELNIKKFSDIAGLYEVKKDMKCLVDFLKNNEKYKEMGATLPRGVILYGPPGTGKTLLAKAVAGESNVNFLYMSGSDFIELYVGVGAKRVRELFEEAKNNSPCIIFIDEIDAIGGTRGQKEGSSEDRKTLNALLTEMDGFKNSENILIIGATNRIEDLDSALLRPGRFTDKYCVPLPSTPEERLEIIQLYTKNKKISDNVNLNSLAKDTIGCSPADIEAIINEAAIIAVQESKSCIDKDAIEKALYKKLLLGHAKETKDKSDEELKLVAWHEAGHALAGLLLDADVTKVTIISSTSGAGGATFITPKKLGLYSVKDLENEVIQLYAGKIAEYLLFDNWENTTTGASNDIEKATSIIYQMISIYGMTEEYGMLNLRQLNINNDKILIEVSKISNNLKEKTLKMLVEHKKELSQIAELLLEKETIYIEDLKSIIK